MQVILRSAQKPTDYDTVAVALCTLFIERKQPFRYGDTPPTPQAPAAAWRRDLRRLIAPPPSLMRIVLAAFGSRGDTQPHIAFAVEVRRLPRVRVSTRALLCHSHPPRTFHSHLCFAPFPRTFPSHLPLAPSPRTFPSHLLPSHLSLAPSPRTFPWHLPLVFPSHRPLAPSTRTLPSVGVQLSSLHSSIPRSWSAPATKSACTSLRSTCRWCPRSRGCPSSAPSKQLRVAWKSWLRTLLPAMRPQ